MTEAPSHLFDLSGSVATVIGGTGTLGAAMATALASHGASVAVVGRNVNRGEIIAATLREITPTAAFYKADASNRDELEAARATIDRDMGATDVLIAAVGGNDSAATVTAEQPFEALSLDAWQDCVSRNLDAGLLLPAIVFAPSMVAKGLGSIITIASVAASLPLSRVPAYSAAKAAMLNLTRFLAREYAPAVRVNAITPGFFVADQNRDLLLNADGTPTARGTTILDHTPMNRFGDPDELGGAAVYLASHRASRFVTGTELRVDGGFLATSI